MTDGIINVYKERGFTSHDVVAKLRGILKMKKIGHTGTLDPEAEGVLPVCLGKATKVCELLTDKEKTYQAVLLLGTVTDTQDTTGEVLETHPVVCSEEAVCEAAARFTGDILQVPPMYSALKVNGKKLYELARQGIEVERKARPVTIKEIRIDEIRFPRVTMTVTCSKGTYIRTLCHDIGASLGCGGCMEKLLRTKVGPFILEDSVRLSEIEQKRDEGRLEEVIRPTDSVFMKYQALLLNETGEKAVRNGNPIRPELAVKTVLQETSVKEGAGDGDALEKRQEFENRMEDGIRFRVYDASRTFLAVYEWRSEKHCLWPVKMFL